MFKKGRFSGWIRPIAYTVDICIIYIMAYFILLPYINTSIFAGYIAIAWLLLSLSTRFYVIYRYTHATNLLILLAKQTVMFGLVVYAYFGYHGHSWIHSNTILKYTLLSMLLVAAAKFSLFYLLKRYRSHLKGNLRKVIVLGNNAKTKQLEDFFNTRQEYGYHLRRVFDVKELKQNGLEALFYYIQKKGIDEVYVSLAEIDNKYIQKIINFADNNLIVLKFLPDNKDIFSRKMHMQYYGVLPIIALRSIPMDKPLNRIIKRAFDIIVSLLVMIFILSWFTPLMAILIRLDSKGPIFFKQKRNGLDYEEFDCYKFRSMRPNPTADLHQVSRGDQRITRVGKFLRKTSLDELPQFINVLFGDMSTVGPRPHMVSHTHMYAERVDKFMVRHFVKPGITGLAQVSGYRGEVESEKDIINRVRYDIFYLENWSLFLDLKIIFLTVYNIIKGEDKAY